MKRLTSLFLVLSSLFLLSCGSEDDVDCSSVICISPGILLEFIDKESNENLLENGAINAEDIKVEVSNMTDSEVQINNIGVQLFVYIDNWKDGNHDVSVSVNSNNVLEMSLDTETTRSECCSGKIISDFEITGGEFEEIDDYHIAILMD